MAPKHGPRGKAPKKQLPTVPDSEHIVFTNNQNAAKPKENKEAEPDPPRPDAKKIIGGASWTGKLPVNLLSEHCQRQKWNKPEYSMRRVPEAEGGGHRSAVTLSTTNPKTKEVTTLPPFQLPAAHAQLANQPTPLEARHFAAAYALFRISSMKNIHMTLPPQFRDLWKGEFARLKQEDVTAGHAWKYDADPFAAEAERKRIHIAMDKQKAKRAEELSSSAALNLLIPGRDSGKGSKIWDRAPKAEMGNKIRADVEALVRDAAIWNPYGTKMSVTERESIIKDLSSLGFRRSHVEEAVKQCKDREESLEWLLIHVPEDDLPPWSFPESYSAGVSLASGDLAKEGKLKRLALAGYSSDLCAKVLQENGGDEGLAAAALQQTLIPGVGKDDQTGGEGAIDDWDGEMAMLEAIFVERYSMPFAGMCSISGEADTPPAVTIQFRRPPKGYPLQSPPIIAIHTDKLPAYIRLSATRQALLFAHQNLLGNAMIFNLVEWLETNMPRIVNDPGLLRDISQPSASESLAAEPGERFALSEKLSMRSRHEGSNILDRRGNQELYDAWKIRQTYPAQQKMLNARKGLPAWHMQEAVVDAIKTYQCVIISGETGSGKSTQSVQFVLDHLIDTYNGSTANILCTQPRRISALGLADRVSSERCSNVGDEVGYIIRGDSKVSRGKTKITFMTTGVLLRRMQSSSDILQSLAGVTHIFVDEVHERGVDTDFLLALLRDALKARDGLKLVLMSATLDAEVFSNYFGGSGQVGHVHISGRTFPVTDLYLDDVVKIIGYSSDIGSDEQGDLQDRSVGRSIRSLGMGINYDLVADLVRHLDTEFGSTEGSILIFLPGTFEIDRCLAAINRIPNTYGLPLHASLMPAEQRRVFLAPPKGKRKVIAATNVAETSITIEDIVAVIDTGRVKETAFDPTDNIVRLVEVWASQAATKQRRGRAGRVRAGICYKLFTRAVEASMAPRPEPEIRRIPLEQLCLSVKGTAPDRDVAQFLRQTLTPPEEGAIEVAMSFLHRIGALDKNQLTALGRHLSMIPADLRCAKLLVYGSIFACMEACLTIAAILTTRSPFVSPREKREEAKTARLAFSNEHGDLLLDVAAYNEWWKRSQNGNYRIVQDWCSANFLSQQNLRDISSTRSQLLSSLKDASILPLDYNGSNSPENQFNSRNDNKSLLRALIAGALNPQIAKIEFPDKKFAASIAGAVELDPEARTIKYFNQENGRVFVHPSSTLFDSQSYSGSATYISYFSKMATSKTFIRDLTPFNPYTLLLFGGPIELDRYGKGLIVDEWLRLRGWARIGVLVSRLRILLDDSLRKRIDRPGIFLGSDGVIDMVRRLVEFNGQDR